MSHLDILLPFGLPPQEMAADLLRELKMPALATLVSRAGLHRHDNHDPFARSLPHEHWLSSQFGLGSRLAAGGSPPVALAAMESFGLKQDAGVWFVLQPVHFHVARDHLVLTSWRKLAISDHESRQLFEVAKQLFDEMAMPLLYGDAHHWFVRADAWEHLQTATPDAACGHNIDIWLPSGSGERSWRKVQNEVQMTWHGHPVNSQREEKLQKPVNSLWLWGGTPAAVNNTATGHRPLYNLPDAGHTFARYRSMALPEGSADRLLAEDAEHAVAVLDTLMEPALSGDWAEWLARYHLLEKGWFEPLLAALKTGRIKHISLIVTHSTSLLEFAVSRQSLRKFWVRPSLAKFSR